VANRAASAEDTGGNKHQGVWGQGRGAQVYRTAHGNSWFNDREKGTARLPRSMPKVTVSNSGALKKVIIKRRVETAGTPIRVPKKHGRPTKEKKGLA